MNKKIIIGIITLIAVVLLVLIGIKVINKTENQDDQKKLVSGDSVVDNVENGISTEKNENKGTEKNTNDNPEEGTDSESQGRILIAFFSRADENYNVGVVEVGNTEIMAGFIKDYLGDRADVFKIDPVKSYPTDYDTCTTFATYEKEHNARPEFKGDIDLSKYDTIFLGYPIWWGDVPMIINTFLEKYDFSGKTIIPFCTHEGSGNANTFGKIKTKMTASTVNTNGLAIRGSVAREEESRDTVKQWLVKFEF